MNTFICLFIIAAYALTMLGEIRMKFKSVFLQSNEKREAAAKSFTDGIVQFAEGKTFEFADIELDPSNPSSRLAMKWMEFSLIYLNPIITATMLIPAMLFIKTIPVVLGMQIAIALFFVLFMVIFPSLAGNSLFNGKINWYSRLHQKSVLVNVVSMLIALTAYSLGIAFLVPFI